MRITYLFLVALIFSCNEAANTDTSASAAPKLQGSWKLISGTLIENGDTMVTDYTRDRSFIKIINDTHFAFLHHDLKQGKDSGAVFSAGGGTYKLNDSSYTEQLEYCSDRNWEGHDFPFTVSIINDTLIQSGIEKIERAGINRLNIEKYTRVTKAK